jgi:DNA-binding winged helix-turn-helix (wHTH) protein
MRAAFDAFVFDSDLRVLTRDGSRIHLTPKAFDLLHLLLERRPRPVPGAEIMDHLWPGCFVARGNLANLVLEVRTALGDDGRTARYIRTVHRFGYVFDASVQGDDVPTDSATGPEAGSVASTRSLFRLLMEDGQVSLSEGTTTLGRCLDCTVTLPSTTVSRCHARIVLDAGRATLEDLQSKNGTFVNGARIDRVTALTDGDRIRLGGVPMVYRLIRQTATDTFVAPVTLWHA